MNLNFVTMNDGDLIVRKVEIEEAYFLLRKDGIVCVKLKDDTELDIPLQWKLMEVYDELTDGIKSPFIFEAGIGCTVTKEARDNAIKLEERSPMGACAVIVTNTANLLIANFYYKFNKPNIPYKVFKKFDQGVEWLKTTSCYHPHRILNKIE